MGNLVEKKDIALQLESMSSCVNVKKQTYQAGEHVMSFGSRKQILGVVARGHVDVIRTDIEGNLSIMKKMTPGSVFNDAFSCTSPDSFYVLSKTESEIYFIDYPFIFQNCPIHCPIHNQMVHLILELFTQNSIRLNEHIEILSRTSIRDKIMSFLYISMGEDYSEYTLSFSFSDLANYLCVDRSAMMRELKKMEQEKVIERNGKKIKLL